MKNENTDQGVLEIWTPEEVAQALDKHEIALIDVRTPQEYMFEHIPGALLFPMSFFDAAHLPSQEGKRLVFYCGSSVRSGKMAQKAMAAGYSPMAHLEGGFGNWKKSGQRYVGTEMSNGAPKEMTA